jgi:hypothetical protein
MGIQYFICTPHWLGSLSGVECVQPHERAMNFHKESEHFSCHKYYHERISWGEFVLCPAESQTFVLASAGGV